ncbi:MAG TPA: hypothetical protein VIL49_03540 [Capillimicrobium sp.]
MGRLIQRMLAITAVLLLLAGCGGSDSDATAVPTATTAAIANVPLSIDEPDDAPLRAEPRGALLVGRAPVRGSAQPYSVLRVTSECAKPACTTGATADENGRWVTALRVEAPPGKPYARVTAELSGESAVALVRLKAEGVKAGRRPGKQGKRGRQGLSGTRGGGAAAPGVVPEAQEEPSSAAPAPAGGVSSSSSSLGGPGPIPAPTSGGTPTLRMIGDSLAEGTASLLPGQLPGWSVSTDAETGRSLRVGMERWAATRASTPPTVAAFSLFTNDDPGSVAAFEAAVRQTAEEPAGTCVVWATIARPPVGGRTYAAANAALERVAAAYPTRIMVVPWARAVQANPGWLRSDRVHATPEGYAARARMYAEAARACSGR